MARCQGGPAIQPGAAGRAYTFPWGAADALLGGFFPVQIPVHVAARSPSQVASLGHTVSQYR